MRFPVTLTLAAAGLLLAGGCAAGAGDPAEGAAVPVVPPLPDGPPAVEPEPIEAGRAAPAGAYDQPVDVRAYDLEVAVSDTAGWIAGRAAIDVEVTGTLAGPFALDFTGLAVDRVLVDGLPVEARHEAGRLHVPLPPGAAPGDVVAIEVAYRGVPDDGLILGRTVHGDPSAFVDNWPNRARFWFPGVDHPSDKATTAITVHAPASWDVVANGALVAPAAATDPATFGPAASEPRRTWRWEHDVPISTYNVVFGGAVMVRDTVGLAACGRAPASTRDDGCVAVTTWLFPQSVESGSPSFVRAAEMVDRFTDLIAPFPYAKLANVQSATRFGGMENASAIFYSERALAGGADIEGTVSHEIAHQWFGDAVTEADWRHLWLSEGFATYFGAWFFQVADGEEAFRSRMEASKRSYLASDVVGRPIVDTDVESLFDLLNANNYQKGGWVLHMLRDVLGDEAFFDGIRTFYRRHAHGTALTEDFRAAMEEVSGEELGWFFDQWIYSPGHPVLRHAWTEPDGGGPGALRIEQLQTGDWPTYRIPLTVELHAGDGEVTRRRVVLDERTETFELAVEGAVERVVLDPDGKVLFRPADAAAPGPGS